MNNKKGIYILISFIFVILLISIVSAGLWSKITGKAQGPQPQNIALNVVGINPIVIEYIEALAPQQPTEADTPAPTTVTFEIRVTDPDGVQDINPSTVRAWFTKLASPDKSKVLCLFSSNIDSDTDSYSCSIDMNYFDASGDWSIRAEAADFGNTALIEDGLGITFTYQQLAAMTNSQPSLTWPNLVPSAIDQTSDNDPATIANTGNYVGNVKITAYDLVGTDSTPFPANLFTIGETTGALEECDAPATAAQMADSTSTIVAATPGGGNANNLYYCITTVPSVPTQAYSTTTSWMVVYEL